MYKDLLNQTKELLASKEVVILGISGHGGSGKTTLAERLARDNGVSNDRIVRLDNLHAKDYQKATNLFGLSDWPELFRLLADVRGNDRLVYRTRDWKGEEGVIDVPRPSLVIFEGVRLLRPEAQRYFDLSVWIDCPLDVASTRAVERNRQQGDSKAELELWDTKWIPEARRYAEQIHPEKLADFVYTDYES